ncbi:MAG: divergent PAP2 family protein [Candidatus Omnitrophica bacterium]|nr:divergent PAP2 family protein [Candidatus Omnitrophota bacterium]
MGDFFGALFRNKVLLIAVLSWFIAQSVKVLLGIIKEKRFNFKWFVGTGGMPSSHAAGVAALAMAVGLSEGFDSVIFAVSLLFAVIVMFDAQGVRQDTGIQAEVLNEITDDIYFKRGIKEEKLRELVGHTPVEVLAGMILGILVSLVFC